MTSKNDFLIKNIIVRKDFSYTKKGINLNFILRVDNSSELKSFRACLIEAINDIDEILKGMKN